MNKNQKKQIRTLNKEFRILQRQEDKLLAAAMKQNSSEWKAMLEEKIPPKVYQGLHKAFCEGFSLVFQHGRKAIELTYKKEKISDNYRKNSEAFQNSGKRRDIRRLHKDARKANSFNMAVTTVEGIGLGALGIGMPDIVLFLTTVLRGIYETALQYGFGYESRFEQMLILKMMAASLSSGPDWFHRNKEVNEWILEEDREIAEEDFREQIRDTASVFAVDMLLLKFVQGLPVVGILGGAANPLYYKKILRYIQVKYKKRYLLNHQKNV